MLYERKSTAHLVGKWAYMEIATGWEYFYKLEGFPPNTQILLQFGFIYAQKTTAKYKLQFNSALADKPS